MKITLGDVKKGQRFALAGIRGSMIAADDAKPAWQSGIPAVRVLGLRANDAMPIEARADTKVTLVMP